jgi:hypothetical protein
LQVNTELRAMTNVRFAHIAASGTFSTAEIHPI